MAKNWITPTPAAAALLREAAEAFLEAPGDLIAQVDAEILRLAPEELRDEPLLAKEAAASNRANLLHWARHTAADPGARVPVNLSPEVMAIARDAVRRGLQDKTVETYRVGQNVAWRYCMEIAFSLSDDPEVLRDGLAVASQSIFAFVGDTIGAIEERIAAELAALTGGTHADRFEAVSLVLEGSISAERASRRLSYELDRPHTAVIVWGDQSGIDHGVLNQVAGSLAKAANAERPLAVLASDVAIWAWFSGGKDADAALLAGALGEAPGVRAAIGPREHGIEGFRRSHLDALSTQRLMLRATPDVQIGTFSELRLVALCAQDEDGARQFVRATLGELGDAEQELRDTVRAYVREQFSATRAAKALFAHRNTVLNRIRRAEELLPVPLESSGLEVGVALELHQWLGA